MPDNIKYLLNQDLDIPFIVGMVAQAKTFIIDKAMMSLICSFLGAGIICGGLLHQVSQLNKTQEVLQSQMSTLVDNMNKMTLSQNIIANDVRYVRRDIDQISVDFANHFEKHMVRIVK